MSSNQLQRMLSIQVWLQWGWWCVQTDIRGAKPVVLKQFSKFLAWRSLGWWRLILKSPVTNAFSLGKAESNTWNSWIKFSTLPLGGRYTTPSTIGLSELAISTNRASISGVERFNLGISTNVRSFFMYMASPLPFDFPATLEWYTDS